MVGRMTPNMIEARQGDSFDIAMRFQDKCSKPMDITGWTIKMQARDKINNLEVFSINGEIVDALNGKAVIKLTPIKTTIPVGDYNTDIQITASNGSVHTVYPQNVNQVGLFRITQQVTE